MVFYNGFNLLVDIVLVALTWHTAKVWILSRVLNDIETSQRED